MADTNYNTDCDEMTLKEMMLKGLSNNEYLKVKGIIDGAYITPLAKEKSDHTRAKMENLLVLYRPPQSVQSAS